MPKRSNRTETSEQTSDSRPLERHLTRLDELMGLIYPLDLEVVRGQIRGSNNHPLTEGLRSKPCESYDQVILSWQKALHWTEGLDHTLAIMLAASMSTNLVGEQLWFKILGPPSCGKTTLLEALATARAHVLSKDTIRGFYSGWSSQQDKDQSIAGLSRGMVLATKDGDTLLKAPGREQILAEARGLYDRAGRTHYRNQVAIDYEGHRMTWLICGTSALRELDESELGARLLDCVLMEEIDEQFEDGVAWMASQQEMMSMRVEADGKPETHYSPELAESMSLTGGYLEYLRKNAVGLCTSLEVPKECLRYCNRLGKFVALMRARPGIRGHAQREFSTRLVKQFTRLVVALSPTIGKNRVDREVMERARKVALDTSQGIGIDITRGLYDKPEGVDPRSLSLSLHHDESEVKKMLRFMRRINVVETFYQTSKTRYGKVRGSTRWRLSEPMRELFKRVVL